MSQLLHEYSAVPTIKTAAFRLPFCSFLGERDWKESIAYKTSSDNHAAIADKACATAHTNCNGGVFLEELGSLSFAHAVTFDQVKNLTLVFRA